MFLLSSVFNQFKESNKASFESLYKEIEDIKNTRKDLHPLLGVSESVFVVDSSFSDRCVNSENKYHSITTEIGTYYMTTRCTRCGRVVFIELPRIKIEAKKPRKAK